MTPLFFGGDELFKTMGSKLKADRFASVTHGQIHCQ